MSAPRCGVHCDECGTSCRTTYVRTRADGTVTRRYVCDNGHRFTVNGTAPKRAYRAKTPPKEAKLPRRLAPLVAGRTEWRPYPFTDTSALQRAAI